MILIPCLIQLLNEAVDLNVYVSEALGIHLLQKFYLPKAKTIWFLRHAAIAADYSQLCWETVSQKFLS